MDTIGAQKDRHNGVRNLMMKIMREGTMSGTESENENDRETKTGKGTEIEIEIETEKGVREVMIEKGIVHGIVKGIEKGIGTENESENMSMMNEIGIEIETVTGSEKETVATVIGIETAIKNIGNQFFHMLNKFNTMLFKC